MTYAIINSVVCYIIVLSHDLIRVPNLRRAIGNTDPDQTGVNSASISLAFQTKNRCLNFKMYLQLLFVNYDNVKASTNKA